MRCSIRRTPSVHANRSTLVALIGTLVVTTDASTAVAQHGAPADGEWRTYGGDPPELIALGLPD